MENGIDPDYPGVLPQRYGSAADPTRKLDANETDRRPMFLVCTIVPRPEEPVY
jgi:hypothetical protein